MENSRLQTLGPELFYAMHRVCSPILLEPGDRQYVDVGYAIEDALAIKMWLGGVYTPARNEIAMDEVPFAPC